MWSSAVVSLLLAFTSIVGAAPAPNVDSDYEYIIVGSGAGGGPLASRLARAGKKTLLIEAGDDQIGNDNTTVPAFQAIVTQDPKMRWDFFVNHYQDLERAKQDPKFAYDIGNGQQYVGLTPPPGAKPLGILYPRSQMLGGCVTHNALIWITAHDSDWNYISTITGDDTWAASNMGQYLDKVYEWQSISSTDPTILLRDFQLTQHLAAGAAVMGAGPKPLDGLVGVLGTLLTDPNGRVPGRDSKEGLFQIPLITSGGARKSVREHILETVDEGYPLTIRRNTFVTKVDFDSSSPPKATGVSYLQGANLYKASPLSGGQGTPGSVKASKEVILSGGSYNTVQLLKLSGVGPAAELQKFNIPVLSDLPGLGKNMQDRYEIPITAAHETDFPLLKGCTFDMKDHDECYKEWKNNPNILSARGAYATNGLAATMSVHSDFADTSDIDLYIFGSPTNFTGYFPGWGDDAVRTHNNFAWYALKAHTRNTAGTVELRSTNPLDTPIINFNYFDTGTTTDGADKKDLSTLVQALKMGRDAFDRYRNEYPFFGGSKFTEQYPGPEVQTDEQLETYVKNRAWGHHASCTAPIGADDDPNAVLDSKFKVRGVQGLRVVDASVFPKIPGVFIQSPIMVVSEKAADTILSGH
ncbi:alcohol oxidase [Pseudovirgaria hyperparasitica]|uniref:Alcohol oxidase n=1 Tax=Pseudovirgaria hyperparasitica TaxID=470096 RepID=A0A6A6VSB2_9PEZI|nr:alcohol oxidase [Pseudovirgaria hyperparasitica]KAF2753482.1 alcohol oxidase [Pseudovirgaria hyperparasitica]